MFSKFQILEFGGKLNNTLSSWYFSFISSTLQLKIIIDNSVLVTPGSKYMVRIWTLTIPQSSSKQKPTNASRIGERSVRRALFGGNRGWVKPDPQAVLTNFAPGSSNNWATENSVVSLSNQTTWKYHKGPLRTETRLKPEAWENARKRAKTRKREWLRHDWFE